jgi:hypothetical protein
VFERSRLQAGRGVSFDTDGAGVHARNSAGEHDATFFTSTSGAATDDAASHDAASRRERLVRAGARALRAEDELLSRDEERRGRRTAK